MERLESQIIKNVSFGLGIVCVQWVEVEGQGRIQDFKLGGAHLNKLHRAAGGAKIVGVFRVKNHDFYAKKSYFFQF